MRGVPGRRWRRIARRWAAAAALLPLAGPACASPGQDQELRLATIGYHLSAANASGCAAVRPLTGMLLHELGQYDARDRAAVVRASGLGDGIGLLALVPGGAAARAGLRAGDEIVAVDGEDVTANAAPHAAHADFTRMGRFEDGLARRLAAGPAMLAVRRGGALLSLALAADPGCGGDVVLAPSGALDAWSDGGHVAVTTRLAAFAADDGELAFVVAHEMAHNLLGHNAGAGGHGLFGGSKALEIAADRAAILLMARAGYRADGAERFLVRAAALRPFDLPLSHPGIARRLRIVAAAAAALPPGEPAAGPG